MVKNKNIPCEDYKISKDLQSFYDQEFEDFLNNFEKDVKFSFSILSSDQEKYKKKVNYKYLINQQKELLSYYNNFNKNQIKIKNNLIKDYLLALQLDKLINQPKNLDKKSIKNKKKKATNNNSAKILFNQQFSTRISPIMKKYIQKISNGNYILGIMETGGGGDCLFSSISEGIKQAFINPLINENQCFTVQELRRIVRNTIMNWNSETYKDNLEVFKALEETGEWDDLWSPAEIKNKIELADQFLQTGNNHWGTDFDIDIISDKLNIGILILRSESNLAELYSLVSDYSKKKKKYYMLIYNINMYHYKLAGLKNNYEPFTSVYNTKDLPNFLKEEYYSKCKYKI